MFQNTNYSYTLYIAYLRASSYEPGNRAGSVTRTNSVVCSYGKFQPETGMNARNTNKMVEHNLYYSRQSEPCGPFNFINKAFSHTPEVEIRTRPKLIPFWPLSGESKAILSKMFRPDVSWLECSYGKIFIPVIEISVAKTEISVTGPARPLI